MTSLYDKDFLEKWFIEITDEDDSIVRGVIVEHDQAGFIMVALAKIDGRREYRVYDLRKAGQREIIYSFAAYGRLSPRSAGYGFWQGLMHNSPFTHQPLT